MLRPLHNEVQVRIKKDAHYKGINLPELSGTKKNIGIIIACGKSTDPMLKPGQMVLIENYNLKVPFPAFDIFLPDDQIMAILEKEDGEEDEI